MIMIMIASPWSFAAFSLWCRVQFMNLGQSTLLTVGAREI